MGHELGTANLRLEREGSIAWCVIDRPAARNALTPAMYFGLKRAVHLVNTDPDLAALIITASTTCSRQAVISADGPNRAMRPFRRGSATRSSRS